MPCITTASSSGPGRRTAFDRVLASSRAPSFPAVFAGAEPEMEAWLVAGFQPETADEARCLEAVRAEWGFRPETEPHRLSSTVRGGLRKAKDMLARLTRGDLDRVWRCLLDLDRLRDRGGACGLTRFLADFQQKIVPAFSTQPA